MKFKVWDENSINENDNDVCYLKLDGGKSKDNVILRIVNKDGSIPKNSSILVFEKNTRCLIIMSNINPDYYIKSDYKGYPIIVTEEEHEIYMKNFLEEIAVKEMKEDFKRMLSKKEIEENTIQ